MKINHIIVHSVKKEQYKSETIVDPSDEELVIDENVISLMDGIRNVYTQKSGKAYSKLNSIFSFSQGLTSFYNNKTTFVNFTKDAMVIFKSRISKESFATGGYLIFSDYTNNGTHYFMIVMLKSKEGWSFNDLLKLTGTKHLELDKLHFAARIDLDLWKNKDKDKGNYVSFINGRSSATVTDYFKKYLGIDDNEFSESAKVTKDLVTAVTNYCNQKLQLDINELNSYKFKVHNYCKDKLESNEPVYLNELSEYLDKNTPSAFLEYAQEKYKIPNEIHIDKSKLSKLVKFYGKDKDLTISFSSDVYGKRIKYEKGVLIIHDIPEDLRVQLMVEKNKYDSSKE